MKVTIGGDVQIEYAPDEQNQAIDLIQTLRQLESMDSDQVIIAAVPVDELEELARASVETMFNEVRTNGDARKKTINTDYLTPAQLETYDCLIDSDHPDGTTVSQVADMLGITPSAAGVRLRLLCGIGYARRVARGHYRAVIK